MECSEHLERMDHTKISNPADTLYNIGHKVGLPEKLVKEGYDRGIIFGCKVNATKVVNTLKEMTSENFEIIKDQIIGFCKETIRIADSNKKERET